MSFFLNKRLLCLLQLSLALASAVTLGSESRWTLDIVLSKVRVSPNLEGQVPVYINPPGTGWPSYTPRYWVSFSSLPTTRRATVEVSKPASTRGTNHWTQSSLWPAYNFSAGTAVSNHTSIAGVDSLLWRRACLPSLPSNGSGMFAYLASLPGKALHAMILLKL
jgi:hypothetical protein